MSEAFLGEIRIFAGPYAPVDWHYCDGTLLNVSDYQALYSLIGTTFGGTGGTTFGLPDYRGRLVIGMGQGTYAGATNRVLGQSGGTETVALAIAQVPAHSHTFSVSTAQATSMSPTGNYLGAVTPSGPGTDDTFGLYGAVGATATTVVANANFLNCAYGSPGGTAPHENAMPSIAINYIIALVGTYPNRQN